MELGCHPASLNTSHCSSEKVASRLPDKWMNTSDFCPEVKLNQHGNGCQTLRTSRSQCRPPYVPLPKPFKISTSNAHQAKHLNSASKGGRLQDLCPADREKLGRLILELASAQQALAARQSASSGLLENHKFRNFKAMETESGGKTFLGSLSNTRSNECSNWNYSQPAQPMVEQVVSVMKSDSKNKQELSQCDLLTVDTRGSFSEQTANRKPHEEKHIISIVTNQQAQLRELSEQLKLVTRLLARSQSKRTTTNPSNCALLPEQHRTAECGVNPITQSTSVACQTETPNTRMADQTQVITEFMMHGTHSWRKKRHELQKKNIKLVSHQTAACQTTAGITNHSHTASYNTELTAFNTVGEELPTKITDSVHSSLPVDQPTNCAQRLSSLDEVNNVLSVIQSLDLVNFATPHDQSTGHTGPIHPRVEQGNLCHMSCKLPSVSKANEPGDADDREAQLLHDLFFLHF